MRWFLMWIFAILHLLQACLVCSWTGSYAHSCCPFTQGTFFFLLCRRFLISQDSICQCSGVLLVLLESLFRKFLLCTPELLHLSSTGSCSVPCPILKPWIHFKLIFVQSERYQPNLRTGSSNLPSIICKEALVPLVPDIFYQKLCGCGYVVSFVDPQVHMCFLHMLYRAVYHYGCVV